MAYTQDQLTALENALANGTVEVRYGDNLKRFRSLAELREAIAEVKAGLATQPPIRQVRINTCKGV